MCGIKLDGYLDKSKLLSIFLFFSGIKVATLADSHAFIGMNHLQCKTCEISGG